MRVDRDDWRFSATALMIWFIAWRGVDYMATLYRTEAGDGRLEYRFRYDAGGDAWDGRDRKSWYGARARPGTGEAGIEELRTAARALFLAQRDGAEGLPPGGPCGDGGVPHVAEEVPVVDGDLRAALGGKPWAHIKRVSVLGAPVDE